MKFNLALRPVLKEHQDLFFKAAEGLEDVACGYWLEPGVALPHVTLCPFDAEDAAVAMTWARPWLGRRLDVVNAQLYFLIDPRRQPDIHWFGYASRRDAALLDLQEDVVQGLKQRDPGVAVVSRDAYFPHFTLARVSEVLRDIPQAVYSPSIWGAEIPVEVGLGLAGEHGIVEGWVFCD